MTANPKIMIATPRIPGHGCPEHDTAICGLMRSPFFNIMGHLKTHTDVIRVRERTMHRAVNEFTDATHLLFIDSDVEVNDECIGGMFRANRDIVAAPYPLKKIYKFSEHEREMYRYAIKRLPDAGEAHEFDNHMCTKVAGIGMGCMMIKTDALRKMMNHYAESLTIKDSVVGEMVALCDLVHSRSSGETADRLSEDMSFCHRATQVGIDVWMYLGKGSPVTHWGTHAFRGSKLTFGLPEDV